MGAQDNRQGVGSPAEAVPTGYSLLAQMARRTDMDRQLKLNPSDGFTVPGVLINQNRFSARVQTAQLLRMCDDPRLSEDPKRRQGDPHLQELFELRSEKQRLFEGAKRQNVPKYAEYIVAVFSGQEGVTPPIVLYSEKELKVDVDDANLGYIQIPWNMIVVAIDGETQLAARFEAVAMNAALELEDIVIDIHHGREVGWAQQAFHDLNLLAVRPNAAVGIGMDRRDPLTHVARRVEECVPFFKGRINTVRRQLRPKDRQVATITSLRGACVTLAEGLVGVKFGAKPVPVVAERVPAIERAALEWWRAVTELLGPAIENREKNIAGAPAVLAAIGAVGHDLVNIENDTERVVVLEQKLGLLRRVNWASGPHWEGIAGKLTPKGRFVVGGPKEVAYAVYSALTDVTKDEFNRIGNSNRQA